MANLADLFAGGARPMLLAVSQTLQALSSGSATLINFEQFVPLNTWNVPVINATSTNPYYQIPFAGWYLVQVDQAVTTGGVPQNFKYAAGFNSVVNGAGAVNTDGGAVTASSTVGVGAGVAACELFQFNTFANTADTVATYAFTNNGVSGTSVQTATMFEWVGLPTTSLTSYTGPVGTVVSSPQLAAAFPPGPGTTLAAPVSAGATSITVASNTGMVTGGTLGLDYEQGMIFQPVAETVSITSVSGTTIGISAAAYPHVSGAPVAVPVSAAFMNQQCRDMINFLAYPPMLRVQPTATQSIPSQVFPAGTQITNLTRLGTGNLDNFTGFATNTYTIPVAGVYFVYGQVYYAGSASAFSYSAGLQVDAGTIQWGVYSRSGTAGAQTVCATVRRNLRFTAGQTIKLYGSQNSGAAMNTVAAGATFSKLMAVWRAV